MLDIKPLSPGLFYSVYYRARSLKSLERRILKMAGIKPVHQLIIGSVEGIAETRQGWLDERCGAVRQKPGIEAFVVKVNDMTTPGAGP